MPSPSPSACGFTRPDPPSALARYVDGVRGLIGERRRREERAAAMLALAAELAAAAPELPGDWLCVGEGCSYGRNLIYRDPDYGFTLLSMVWPPGADAAIHDHGTWCCVAVLQGRVSITEFERDAGAGPCGLRELGTCERGAGETCLIEPPQRDVHRVWNPHGQAALTLHTYGRDILACRIWDLQSRTVERCALDYHNLA